MSAAGSSCHLYFGVMSTTRSVRFVLAERDVAVGSSFFWVGHAGERHIRRGPVRHSERVLGAEIRRRPARGTLAELRDGPVPGTPGPFHPTVPRWRPLVEHPRPLADGQSDPWAVFDGVFEYRARPSKAIAGIEQAVDLRPVPRPLLNFVEVAVVGIARAIRSSWKSTSLGFGSGMVR